MNIYTLSQKKTSPLT